VNDYTTRKNTRLKDYDYSGAGYYFITICSKDKQKTFWNASVGARIARPQLSDIGMVVEKAIEHIPHKYSSIKIDKYVIMPNHIHMIFIIDNAHGRAMRAPTISTVINQMKGYVSKQIGHSIWQKLFHDHIIRDEEDYLKIWQYIDDNPQKWNEDRYYTE